MTKVEGRDEFLKKLVAANPQMKPLLETILSEDALKEMAEPTFAVVPPRAKSPATRSGSETSKLDMGPIGKYETTYNYTSRAPSKGLDKIDVDTNLKYTPPRRQEDGLPFKILKAELTSKEGKGNVLFDTDKGRVNDSKMDLKLEGKLTIEIGGMTTEVELTQTQVSELKTTDNDPTKK